jgi:hypothetical protein
MQISVPSASARWAGRSTGEPAVNDGDASISDPLHSDVQLAEVHSTPRFARWEGSEPLAV